MKQATVSTRFQRMALRPTLLAAAAFALTTTGNAQVGQSALPFLRIEPDARTAALGGTGTTLLDGGYAGFWNPALLGYQQGRSLGFTYSDWLPGVTSGYTYQHMAGNYALPEREGSLSGYLTYFNLGSQIATDDTGLELGTFGNYQMAAGLAYGRNVARRVSAGLGAKFIHSSLGAGRFADGLEISPGQSLAVDLGGLFRSDTLDIGSRMGEFRLGVALSNIGPGIRYMSGQNRSPLPLLFRTGVAIDVLSDRAEIHRLTLSAEASKVLAFMEEQVRGGDTTYVAANPLQSLVRGWGSRSVFNGNRTVQVGPVEQIALGLGLEYWYSGLFAVRGGYYLEDPEYGDRRYMTAGVGVRLKMAEADFSYLHTPEDRHPMSNTVRVSMKIHLQDGRYHRPLPNRKAPFILEEAAEIPVWTHPTVDVRTLADVTIAKRTLPGLPIEMVNRKLAETATGLRGFDVMSSILSAEFMESIARVSRLLSTHREVGLEILGHADATGAALVNDLLGESRSRAVWLALTDFGVGASRMTIAGFGETQPLADNGTARGRADNRRVDFRLTPLSGPGAVDADGAGLVVDGALATYLMGRDPALVEGVYVPRNIELSFDGPLNRGTEFAFTILEADNPGLVKSWAAGLVALLAENPDIRLQIATHIGYPAGSHRFQSELAKARSEKIKMLMVLMGAESSRVDVVLKGDPEWTDRVQGLLDSRFAERTWIFAVRAR